MVFRMSQRHFVVCLVVEQYLGIHQKDKQPTLSRVLPQFAQLVTIGGTEVILLPN